MVDDTGLEKMVCFQLYAASRAMTAIYRPALDPHGLTYPQYLALRNLPAPRVLLGDLNMPAGPARAVTRWKTLARAATFPSPMPRAQLDHILADPRGIDPLGRVVQVTTSRPAFSDHLPLLVQLDR